MIKTKKCSIIILKERGKRNEHKDISKIMC